MTPIRARVSARLAQFVHVIAIDLPAAYDLTLQGSWANGEYHAVEENGLIRSYSDVDFISNTPLSPTERGIIATRLYKAAAACGLHLQDISIRPADEMINMWTLECHENDRDKSRKVRSEFLQFWTLIGAAEVRAAWLPEEDIVPCKRYYYLNKFFLGVWRDLGIVLGHRLDSYRETLLFVAQWLSADICSASYALKLGIETTVPWNTLQFAHRSSILSELRRFMQSTREYESLRIVVTDLTQLDCNTAKFSVMEMLQRAKELECSLPSRKAARARLFQKLTRGS
jgi:hypothetical protein